MPLRSLRQITFLVLIAISGSLVLRFESISHAHQHPPAKATRNLVIDLSGSVLKAQYRLARFRFNRLARRHLRTYAPIPANLRPAFPALEADTLQLSGIAGMVAFLRSALFAGHPLWRIAMETIISGAAFGAMHVAAKTGTADYQENFRSPQELWEQIYKGHSKIVDDAYAAMIDAEIALHLNQIEWLGRQLQQLGVDLADVDDDTLFD